MPNYVQTNLKDTDDDFAEGSGQKQTCFFTTLCLVNRAGVGFFWCFLKRFYCNGSHGRNTKRFE